MSAINGRIMRVQVTNGDAVKNARLEGKSNTGTYFISSLNKFVEYEDVLRESNKFYLDKTKILEYIDFVDKYLPESKCFEIIKYVKQFRDVFNNMPNVYEVKVDKRINDNRYFFRFVDNTEKYIHELRQILIGEVSFLTFELVDTDCYIYPEFDYKTFRV